MPRVETKITNSITETEIKHRAKSDTKSCTFKCITYGSNVYKHLKQVIYVVFYLKKTMFQHHVYNCHH